MLRSSILVQFSRVLVPFTCGSSLSSFSCGGLRGRAFGSANYPSWGYAPSTKKMPILLPFYYLMLYQHVKGSNLLIRWCIILTFLIKSLVKVKLRGGKLDFDGLRWARNALWQFQLLKWRGFFLVHVFFSGRFYLSMVTFPGQVLEQAKCPHI